MFAKAEGGNNVNAEPECQLDPSLPPLQNQLDGLTSTGVHCLQYATRHQDSRLTLGPAVSESN